MVSSERSRLDPDDLIDWLSDPEADNDETLAPLLDEGFSVLDNEDSDDETGED